MWILSYATSAKFVTSSLTPVFVRLYAATTTTCRFGSEVATLGARMKRSMFVKAVEELLSC